MSINGQYHCDSSVQVATLHIVSGFSCFISTCANVTLAPDDGRENLSCANTKYADVSRFAALAWVDVAVPRCTKVRSTEVSLEGKLNAEWHSTTYISMLVQAQTTSK